MKEKSNKKTPKYDSERETRVLLEQMNKSIDTIAEQHGSVKQEINQVKVYMGQRFDRLELAVLENTKDIKVLKDDVTILKDDVKILKDDVKDLKSAQDELKTGQEEIKQKLDAVTIDHENRVTKLEEKIHT